MPFHQSGQRAAAQLAAVEIARLRHGVGQCQALGLIRGTLRRRQPVIVFRHGHAGVLRQILDRLDEAQPGILHQERDRGAVRAAAEAVIELLGWTDGEARRLFAMERAQTHQIGAALLQLHIIAHHVDDVDAVQQVLNEGLWDHGALILRGRLWQ